MVSGFEIVFLWFSMVFSGFDSVSFGFQGCFDGFGVGVVVVAEEPLLGQSSSDSRGGTRATLAGVARAPPSWLERRPLGDCFVWIFLET